MKSFDKLLSEHIDRTGVSDAELARRLGVSRQTVFRWREGITQRPRNRNDVTELAGKLRLSSQELDELLLAAGFPPEAQSEPSIPAAGPELDQGGFKSDSAARARTWPTWPLLLLGAGGLLALLSAGLMLIDAGPFSRYLAQPQPATEGETLVLISPFVNYGGGETGYNVAGRLEDALEAEFQAAGLEDIRVERLGSSVVTEDQALEKGLDLKAEVVVWGEYDSGRVIASITPVEGQQISASRERRWLFPTGDELGTTINTELPGEVRWLALYVLGTAKLHSGQPDQAAVLLTRALISPPEDPESLGSIYHSLALVEETTERPDQSRIIGHYTEALKLRPYLVSALNNRAVAYLDRGSAGDLLRAESDLRAALELLPNEPLFSQNLALAMARQEPNNLSEITEMLEQAVEHNPENPGIRNSLCWYYALDRNPDSAMPHCDRAVLLDRSGFSNDSRGLALALMGRYDEAASEFETFLSMLEDGNPDGYSQFVPSREAWIASLEAGQSPFDEAALLQLLTE